MAEIVQSVSITLEKPRLLRFDRAAVKASEKALAELWGPDTTFYSVLQDCSQVLANGNIGRLRFSTVAILLHAGLQHEDPQLTLEQVEEALSFSDPAALIPFVSVIIEAWYVAAPRVNPEDMPTQEAANESDPLGASTGAPSGPSSAFASA